MFPFIERNSFTVSLVYTYISMGAISLYAYYMFSIYETTTNFNVLTSMEKEMLFESDHALYYSYYKTIVEADTFMEGYRKLTTNNLTEYPHTINVIERFYIFPEILIGFLYRLYMSIANTLGIQSILCVKVIDTENNVPQNYHNLYTCKGPGLPINFYILSTGCFATITAYLLYMYATYLSRNKLGGLLAVIYYFIVHNHATQVYKYPAARSNFGIPFLLYQMLYLTRFIEQHTIEMTNKNTPTVESSLSISSQQRRQPIIMNGMNALKFLFLTTMVNLSWEYSIYFILTQTVIMIFMYHLNWIQKHFLLQYLNILEISILFLIFVMGYDHYVVFICSLLMITNFIYEKTNSTTNKNNNNNENNEQTTSSSESPLTPQEQPQPQPAPSRRFLSSITDKIERVSTKIMLFTTVVYILQLFFKDWPRLYDETIGYYTNFIGINQLIHLCDADYMPINFDTVKMYNNIFLSKLYGVVVIVFISYWMRKRREIPENLTEKIERAKNYLLEDYLEENKLTMKDLTNMENDKAILKLLKLLEKCNYDYDRYKLEKLKILPLPKKKKDERLAFLNDVKKFKGKIYEMKKQTQNDNLKTTTTTATTTTTTMTKNNTNEKLIQPKKNNKNENEKCVLTEDDDDQNDKFMSDNEDCGAGIRVGDDDDDIGGGGDDEENSTEKEKNERNEDADVDNKKNVDPLEQIPEQQNEKYIQPYYFFNVFQLVVFFISACCILKLKYLLSSFSCVMISSFPPKHWFPKTQHRYWTIYSILVIISIADIGIQNFKTQYKSKLTHDESLADMINWIDLRTEKNAVFAGPVNIISTVMLITKRPIVNHSGNEFNEIRKRNDLFYTVFSKQSPSQIYNQLAMLNVQYVILTYKDCFLSLSESINCKLSEMWDILQPELKNNKQFCAELFQKSNPESFSKVFSNEKYIILRLFSHSVKVELNVINELNM